MTATTTTQALRGLNGYDLHAEVTQDGTVTFRVRSRRTGKVQANVVVESEQAAFFAGWLNRDTTTY